jgi:hypothetical protein
MVLACIIYCHDNNLTPSSCSWIIVVRLLPTGHLGSHWFSRHRGYSSRLRRGILMWKLPRLRGAGAGVGVGVGTTTTMTMTMTTVRCFLTAAQTASESFGVSPSVMDLSNWSGGEVGATIATLHLPMIRKAMTLLSANSAL